MKSIFMIFVYSNSNNHLYLPRFDRNVHPIANIYVTFQFLKYLIIAWIRWKMCLRWEIFRWKRTARRFNIPKKNENFPIYNIVLWHSTKLFYNWPASTRSAELMNTNSTASYANDATTRNDRANISRRISRVMLRRTRSIGLLTGYFQVKLSNIGKLRTLIVWNKIYSREWFSNVCFPLPMTKMKCINDKQIFKLYMHIWIKNSLSSFEFLK